MPAPKEMRSVNCAVNATEAVHVYSDPDKIWLQLRRYVKTDTDIGAPSFKTAVSLTPALALAIAGELLKAASKHTHGPKTDAPPQITPASGSQQPKTVSAPKPANQPKTASAPQPANQPKTASAPQPANQTKPWAPAELEKLAKAYDAKTPLAQIAATHQRTIKSIATRLRKLGRTVPPQH